jgi:hypothetical protein
MTDVFYAMSDDGDSGGEDGEGAGSVSAQIPFPVHDPLTLSDTSFAVTRSHGSYAPGSLASPPLSPMDAVGSACSAGAAADGLGQGSGITHGARLPLAVPGGSDSGTGAAAASLDASSFAVDSFVADMGFSSTSGGTVGTLPSSDLLRSRPPPMFNPQASLAEVGSSLPHTRCGLA